MEIWLRSTSNSDNVTATKCMAQFCSDLFASNVIKSCVSFPSIWIPFVNRHIRMCKNAYVVQRKPLQDSIGTIRNTLFALFHCLYKERLLCPCESPPSTNTLRPRQNGRRFDIFKCIFLNEKFDFRFKFHWSLFLRVQLTIFQHWFR